MRHRRKLLRRPPEAPAFFPFPMVLILGFAAVAACVQLALGFAGRLTSPAERAASFRPFTEDRVGGIALQDYLSLRTGSVIPGREPLSVSETAEGLTVRWPESKQMDFGTAAAIAPDGYLLTAAHCVGAEPVYVGISAAGGYRLLRARVVWKGDQQEHFDLALLKVEATLDAAFEWAPASEIVEGTELLSAGYGASPAPLFVFACAAGRALGPPSTPIDAPGMPPVATLSHDVPITHGDSGGPLATRDGRLVGINVRGSHVYLGRRDNDALCPDPGWIEALIARDRAR